MESVDESFVEVMDSTVGSKEELVVRSTLYEVYIVVKWVLLVELSIDRDIAGVDFVADEIKSYEFPSEEVVFELSVFGTFVEVEGHFSLFGFNVMVIIKVVTGITVVVVWTSLVVVVEDVSRALRADPDTEVVFVGSVEVVPAEVVTVTSEVSTTASMEGWAVTCGPSRWKAVEVYRVIRSEGTETVVSVGVVGVSGCAVIEAHVGVVDITMTSVVTLTGVTASIMGGVAEA